MRARVLPASALQYSQPGDRLPAHAAWQEAAALLTLVVACRTAFGSPIQAMVIPPYACQDAMCDCGNNSGQSRSATAAL
jgi:hypothetical protein